MTGSPLPHARLRHLGTVPYDRAWQAMQAFTAERHMASADEFWLLEHPPVFTLGRSGRREHLLDTHGIPVVKSDRGGQVTYHGPGQAMIYTLVDIARLGLGIRPFVTALEHGVIDAMGAVGIAGDVEAGAPGVYVNGRKIASIGLRVRRGRTYHGISLNVDMDLAPFSRINPCGRVGLQMTQCSDFEASPSVTRWGEAVAGAVTARLGLSMALASPRSPAAAC